MEVVLPKKRNLSEVVLLNTVTVRLLAVVLLVKTLRFYSQAHRIL